MSAEQDRKFFDMFMLVIGVLVGVAIGIYALARTVQANTQEQYVLEDRLVQAQVEERIQPLGVVAVAGRNNVGLPAPGPARKTSIATSQPTQAAQAAAGMSGEEVYNTACSACHAAGVAGAPKFGDTAAWGPRIEKGKDTLYTHAINGFQGQAGFMPPKGGRTDLSDDSVKAAVDYMVSHAQ